MMPCCVQGAKSRASAGSIKQDVIDSFMTQQETGIQRLILHGTNIESMMIWDRIILAEFLCKIVFFRPDGPVFGTAT
jgi:hypothetical protein